MLLHECVCECALKLLHSLFGRQKRDLGPGESREEEMNLVSVLAVVNYGRRKGSKLELA